MKDFTQSSNNSSNCPATLAADLLRHYSFELSRYDIEQQIEIWLECYSDKWLPVAIIEALYQGRYKVISVEQILEIWQRRKQPIYHFNHEFERLVCGNLPRPIEPLSTAGKGATPLPKPNLSYRKLLLELPSLRAASKLERLGAIPSIKTTLTQPLLNAVAPSSNGTSDSVNGFASHRSNLNGTKASGLDAEESKENASEFAPQEANGNGGYADSQSKAQPAVERPERPIPARVSDREFQEFKEGVSFGLSSGLVVQSLKPRFRLEFSRYYCPNWSSFLNGNTSIDQFAPTAESSPFHSKLRMVAQPDRSSEAD